MSDKSDAGSAGDADSGLNASDVVLAYRLFFDREPESQEVIARHIASFRDLKRFRTAMIRSKEFQAKLPALATPPIDKPLNWPAIRVDVDVSPAQLTEMVRLLEANWEALGRSEPHWSVLTNDQFKSNKIQESEENFFRTGKDGAEVLTSTLARCGVDISSLTTCLELGCGVGRVTVWLSKHFRNVIGIDISRPHILIAEAAARRYSASNISFVHVNSIQALRDLPRFDCFFSVIVLQHNPPPMIYAMLDALLSRLNPGGVAYFQVPTYRCGYSFDAEKYLAGAKVLGQMEVHYLPQPVLFALYAKQNCQVLEVREDERLGRRGGPLISNSFLIQKRQA